MRWRGGEDAVGILAAAHRGRLICKTSREYEDARRIFNGAISKWPLLIAQCEGVQDILRVFQFIRENNLPFSVRAGGHNVAGRSLCDDGVVVDLRRMRSVVVDFKSRIASVEPGATWFDFDREAGAFGLATTGGIISSTGVAGLTLGGGVGWLMGTHGLACDNLIEVDILTASGKVVRCSRDDHTELLWALRGGGGNIGIVTRMAFEVHPVARVYAGTFTFSFGQVKDALKLYRDATSIEHDELTLDCILCTGKDGSKLALIDGCLLKEGGAGQKVIESIRSNAAVVDDTWCWRPYSRWQQQLDDSTRYGRRSYWKSAYLEHLTDEFIDRLVDVFGSAPSPHSLITFDHLHGAVRRGGTSTSSFGHRDRPHLLLINTNWESSDEDGANTKWCRESFRHLGLDAASHTYLNYLGFEEADRIPMTFASGIFDRLREIKAKIDPENVFGPIIKT